MEMGRSGSDHQLNQSAPANVLPHISSVAEETATYFTG